MKCRKWRPTIGAYQDLQEVQENEMQEMAANKELQDDRKRIEASIQQLESEIARGKKEMKNGNYESTQQRATIRKAQEEKCIAQRLLEASEKERRDLEKKLAELERLNRRQEKALEGAAQGWLKKNHEMDVLCEDLRWRMVDSKSGVVVGSHNNKKRDSSSAAGKAAAPPSSGAQSRPDRRPKTTSTSSAAAGGPAAASKKTSGAVNNDNSNKTGKDASHK